MGPYWSYAVLCDGVAQLFLSVNFRMVMNLSHAACPLLCCLSLSLYLSSTDCCVYPPVPASRQHEQLQIISLILLFLSLSSQAQKADCSSPPVPAGKVDDPIRDFIKMHTHAHTLTSTHFFCFFMNYGSFLYI